MSATAGSPGEQISNAIRRAHAQGNPALVAYLTAGYPSKALFTEHLQRS
jgi:tryptophan synthase alpha subunit